jgi:hypothetical protein
VNSESSLTYRSLFVATRSVVYRSRCAVPLCLLFDIPVGGSGLLSGFVAAVETVLVVRQNELITLVVLAEDRAKAHD